MPLAKWILWTPWSWGNRNPGVRPVPFLSRAFLAVDGRPKRRLNLINRRCPGGCHWSGFYDHFAHIRTSSWKSSGKNISVKCTPCTWAELFPQPFPLTCKYLLAKGPLLLPRTLGPDLVGFVYSNFSIRQDHRENINHPTIEEVHMVVAPCCTYRQTNGEDDQICSLDAWGCPSVLLRSDTSRPQTLASGHRSTSSWLPCRPWDSRSQETTEAKKPRSQENKKKQKWKTPPKESSLQISWSPHLHQNWEFYKSYILQLCSNRQCILNLTQIQGTSNPLSHSFNWTCLSSSSSRGLLAGGPTAEGLGLAVPLALALALALPAGEAPKPWICLRLKTPGKNENHP